MASDLHPPLLMALTLRIFFAASPRKCTFYNQLSEMYSQGTRNGINNNNNICNMINTYWTNCHCQYTLKKMDQVKMYGIRIKLEMFINTHM